MQKIFLSDNTFSPFLRPWGQSNSLMVKACKLILFELAYPGYPATYPYRANLLEGDLQP